MRGYIPPDGVYEPFNGTWGDMLNVGEEVFDRDIVGAAAVAANVNVVYVNMFTCRKTEVVTQIRTISGNTAGVGMTLCRKGVYEEHPDTGELTLVAQTANDPTLWTVTATNYTRVLEASFEKRRGRRYGLGLIAVGGTTAPTFRGASSTLTAGEVGMLPRLATAWGGQTDLPAFIAAAQLGGTNRRHYGVLLP